MPSQLGFNSDAASALLNDNSKSYFTNVGYVRTSNFQVEYMDVEPQNTAQLGNTVTYVIPKAADLLGPVDLIVEFEQPTKTNLDKEKTYWSFVESVGYAMIEKITFKVGTTEVESISGDQLYIMNELMKADEARLHKTIGKTGLGAVLLKYPHTHTSTAPKARGDSSRTAASSLETSTDAGPAAILTSKRLIAYREMNDGSNAKETICSHAKDASGEKLNMKLTIPLGLFFTKHPSQYFPLAAIAGCNDIHVSVKLRRVEELIQFGTWSYSFGYGKNSSYTSTETYKLAPFFAATDGSTLAQKNPDVAPADSASSLPTWPNGGPIKSAGCKLRCHMVHVTGPEATALANKEHVRLMKLWGEPITQTKQIKCMKTPTAQKWEVELSFLHPVSEIVFVIRKKDEMSSETKLKGHSDVGGATKKNYFAFHGGDEDPNIESLQYRFANKHAAPVDNENAWIEVMGTKLTLNGQSRHSALSSDYLDKDYMDNRILPMIHSGTHTIAKDTFELLHHDNNDTDSRMRNELSYFAHKREKELSDKKNIFVVPFALNPEGQNPSGHVAFGKVSHAKLFIEYKAYIKQAEFTAANNTSSKLEHSDIANKEIDFEIDVWGVHYNWTQMKDGRALHAFA